MIKFLIIDFLNIYGFILYKLYISTIYQYELAAAKALALDEPKAKALAAANVIYIMN